MNKTLLTPTMCALAAASFLTVHTADAQVFWTSAGGADISRANLDGTSAGTIFSRGELFTGNIIDVAATTSHVYFTVNAAGGGGVYRIDHSGGGFQPIATGEFAGGLQFLRVDPAAGMVYFSDWTAGLFSAPMAGGAATALGVPAASNTGIALGGPNQLLSVAASAGNRNIYSTDLSGPTISSLGEYAATSNQSYGLAYNPATNLAYVTTVNHGNLSVFNLGDNSSTQLLANGSIPRALGMDLNPEGTHLYIVSQTHGNNTGTPGIWTYNLASQELELFLATDASFGVSVIPEPSTYALILGLGVAGLLIVRRRMRR